MDTRTIERQRKALHGLVMQPVLLALVATALLAGIAGGLMRAGVAVPTMDAAMWPGRAALLHAAMMICAFMGT